MKPESHHAHSETDSEIDNQSVHRIFRTSDDVVFGRTPWAEIPLIFALLVSIIGLVHYTIAYPWSVQHVTIDLGNLGVLELGIPPFALVPLILFVHLLHRLYDVRYIITHDAVRCIKGLASLTKSDMRIEFEFIRGIEIDRGLFGRILNYGNLRIGSAMGDRVELDLRDVSNPSFYRDIVLWRMKQGQQIEIMDD